MNRYRVTVTVTETRVCEDDITFDLEAENEETANKEARKLAPSHAKFSHYDFQHDETDTFVQSVEFIEGDAPPDGAIPRCDRTPDMFN